MKKNPDSKGSNSNLTLCGALLLSLFEYGFVSIELPPQLASSWYYHVGNACSPHNNDNHVGSRKFPPHKPKPSHSRWLEPSSSIRHLFWFGNTETVLSTPTAGGVDSRRRPPVQRWGRANNVVLFTHPTKFARRDHTWRENFQETLGKHSQLDIS